VYVATSGDGQVGQQTGSDPTSTHPKLVGRLVHRLFAAQLDGSDAATEEATAARLLTSKERAESADASSVIAEALRVWRSLRARDDVRRLLSGGTCLYEVPFSRRGTAGSPIVRGVIDCLVRRPDGSVVVVEFKTGERRPEHERQLADYVSATRALFPGSAVDGILILA
jgi:ATP-dependent exoDNAse (exonuclease V) beta subunit